MPACVACCGGLPPSPETAGLFYLQMLRGMQVAHSAVFFAPALQSVIRAAAGCPPIDGNADLCADDQRCEGRIFGDDGLRASSALGTVASVGSFAAALVAPAVGAFCDSTPYRRRVGCLGTVIGAVVMLAGVSLAQDTLYFNLACVFVGYFAKDGLILMVTSYLPELSDDIAEEARASGIGNAWLYGTELLSIGALLAVAGAFGAEDADVGRLSGGVLGTASLLLVPLAFGTLYPKPPRVGADEQITSVPQLYGAVGRSFRRSLSVVATCWGENRDYALLLLTALVADPALNGLVVLAAVFLQEESCLKASDVSVVLAAAIFAALPGAVVCSRVGTSVRAARNAQITCLLAIAVVTAVASAAMPRGDVGIAAVFGVLWGLLLGATWQAHGLQLAGCVTPGRESELGGITILAYNCLQWLPPLLFVSMNEATGSMKAALALLVPFYVLGILVLLGVNPERARLHVEECKGRRRTAPAAPDGGEKEMNAANTKV